MTKIENKEHNYQEQIWQVVAQIPKGKISTYGDVAAMAGIPRHARYVGTTLKQLPKNSKLPWHRVVNHKGEIALGRDSSSHEIQKQRLSDEGILFVGQRIPLKTYRWNP